MLRKVLRSSIVNNVNSSALLRMQIAPISVLISSRNPFVEENRELSRESLSNLLGTFQFSKSNIELNNTLKCISSINSLDVGQFDVLLQAAIEAQDSSSISYLMLQKYEGFDCSQPLLNAAQSVAVLESVRKSGKVSSSKCIRRALSTQEGEAVGCPPMDLTLDNIHDMISFCLDRRFYPEALAWFNVIGDVYGPGGMRPTADTFSIVIPAFMHKDKWEETFYLLGEASLFECEPEDRLKLLTSVAKAWGTGAGAEVTASRSNKWKGGLLLGREYLQTVLNTPPRQRPTATEIGEVVQSLFRTAYHGVDRRRASSRQLAEHYSALLGHWETVLVPLLDECGDAKGGRGRAGSLRLLRGDRLGKLVGSMCVQTGAHHHLLADVLRAGGVVLEGSVHAEVDPAELARGCCDVLLGRMEGDDVDTALANLCWNWLVLNDSTALLQLFGGDLSGTTDNEDGLIAAMLGDMWYKCFGRDGVGEEEEALNQLLVTCLGVLGREQALGDAQASVYMAASLCRSLLEGGSPLMSGGMLSDQTVSDMCTLFQCNNDTVGAMLLQQYLLAAPVRLPASAGADISEVRGPDAEGDILRGGMSERTMLQVSNTLLQTRNFSRLFALFQKFSEQSDSIKAHKDSSAAVPTSVSEPVEGRQPLPVKLRDAPSYVLSSCNSYVPLFQSLVALNQHALMVDLLLNDMVGKRGIQPSPEVVSMVMHGLHRADGFEGDIVKIFKWAFSLNRAGEAVNLLSQRNFIWNYHWFRSSLPSYEDASVLLQSCLLKGDRDSAVNAWLMHVGGIIESLGYRGEATGTQTKTARNFTRTTALLGRGKKGATQNLVFTPDELQKIKDCHELGTYMCMSLVTSTRPCGQFSFSRMFYGKDVQWLSLGGIMRAMKVNLWSDTQQEYLVEKVVAMAMVTASRERDPELCAQWLNHIVNDDLYFGKCRVNDTRITKSILFAVRNLGGNFGAIMDVCTKVIENNVVTGLHDVIPKSPNLPSRRMGKYWFDKIRAAELKPGGGCALTQCMGEHKSEQLLKYAQKVEYTLRHDE